MRSLSIAALFAAVLVSACSSAPSSPSRLGSDALVASDNEPLSHLSSDADIAFANSAASFSTSQIAFGQIAQARGSLPGVKQFAKQMWQDNRVRLEQLRRMVAPRELGATQALTVAQEAQRTTLLANPGGSGFDRVYMDMVVENLRAAIAEHTTASTAGGILRVRGYALDALGELNKHLGQALELQKRVR